MGPTCKGRRTCGAECVLDEFDAFEGSELGQSRGRWRWSRRRSRRRSRRTFQRSRGFSEGIQVEIEEGAEIQAVKRLGRGLMS